MKELTTKLLVIGAGPGGYVCGIRAGQLGIDTIVVDFQRAGGTCLNVGCIPSKALIHAAEEFEKAMHFSKGDLPLGITTSAPKLELKQTIHWKDTIVTRLNNGVAGLLKKAGATLIEGRAHFKDGKTVAVESETGTQIIRAETIVIATGSAPVELPFLPFGGRVISSTEALALESLPKTLAIVGGGYIGLELGMAFAKFGTKVTVVEAEQKILPLYDAELTRPVTRRLDKLGVKLLTGAKAKGLSTKGDALLVTTADGKDDKIAADKILVTVGRKPVSEGWGIEEIDLDRNGRFIRVDDQCRTSMRGIYAIGDVTGEPMLAHRAMAQGEMVAELIAGHKRSWDKRAIPAICFTDPEIVSVGASPEEAKKLSPEVKVGLFPFTANGRAMTKIGEEGFVRVVARADNHLVLGIQAVGQGVSELSTAFGLALEMGARLEDIAGTIHAHPTQGEGFQEAALKALGHALHI
ncbi:MAG: dihydrolipoyl dehydrogenase [Alphaproteobacteria bacterium]|nr:dihydrolipoyl dehydrogenase [Alphaproteobacteria bacterium]